MVSLGIDNNYSIYRMKPLILTPRYPGKAYVWSVPDSHGGAVSYTHLTLPTSDLV